MFQQKLSLTTSDIPIGTYRIGWYYNWRYDSASRDFFGRVQIDDVTTIHSHQQQPAKPDSDQLYSVSGFIHQSLTSGIHNIDIDWHSETGADSSFISNTRLEFWRVL